MSLGLTARELVGALRMSSLLLHNIWSLQVGQAGMVLGWDTAPCATHEGGTAQNTLRPKSTVNNTVTLFVEQSSKV